MAKDRAVCVKLLRDFDEHFVKSEGAVPGFTVLGTLLHDLLGEFSVSTNTPN